MDRVPVLDCEDAGPAFSAIVFSLIHVFTIG
jgi:hypothetical protein